MHNVKAQKSFMPQKINGPSLIRSGLIFVCGGLVFRGGGVSTGWELLSEGILFQKCVITFGGVIVFETFEVYTRILPAW